MRHLLVLLSMFALLIPAAFAADPRASEEIAVASGETL